MRRTKFLAVGLAGALSLAAVGCGSDNNKNDNSSSSGGGASSTAQTPDKTPSGPAIKIGTMGSYTGPEAPSLGAMDDTMKAWVAYTNANGGINGHPVKLVVEDDANNPTKAKQLAKKLIEQDKVMAIVGAGSIVPEAWASEATKGKVPVIGSVDFQNEYGTNPYFFPSGAQIPAMVYGLLKDAKAAGVTKGGILPCAEVAICTTFAGLFKAIGGVVGLPFDFQQKITVAQPNYNATCLAAKAKGVDGLVILENAATVVRAADSCSQQGYKPKQLNVAGTAGSAWEGHAPLEGALSTHSNAVPSAVSVPEIKKFNDALDKYAPSVKGGDQFNVLDSSAWAGAEAFKLAAERAKITPSSTPADVIRGLETFKGETLGGLTPPLTFAKGAPHLTRCWFAQQVTGQKFAPANGGKAECIPSADLPKILAILQVPAKAIPQIVTLLGG